MLWQFVALLAVHWFADFVLQTHWQASNKSKRLDALARHVGTYTLALALPLPWLFTKADSDLEAYLLFVSINGILHFVTDYFTSRWSSRHFGPAIRDTHAIMAYTDSYGYAPDDANRRIMEVNPAQHYHNFFVVIGFDQLIHQVTLAATMWMILSKD